MESETSYDSLHFTAQPSPERHPDRIAAAAMLYGRTPVLPDWARILEIGCGTGANVIPIAEMYPESSCLGIDLAASQIELGQSAVKELNLPNCELRRADITDPDLSLGEYDYILCHGVYSWVADEVREALLALIRRCLAPEGLALLSFLGRPAWCLKGRVYEHVQLLDDPNAPVEERIERARDICADLEAKQIDDYTPYGMLLRAELETIAQQSDSLLFHELLNPHTRSFGVSEIRSLLAEQELAYVTDAASFSRCLGSRLSEFNLDLEPKPPETADLLSPQKVHFAVIGKAECEPGKDSMAEVLCRLFVSSPHVPASGDDKKSPVFITPGGAEFRCTSQAGIDVLNTLADSWPAPVSVNLLMKSLSGFALLGRKLLHHEVLGEIGRQILDGVITPHAGRMGILETPPKMPLLRPYARYELQRQKWATNKRHEYNDFREIERRVALLFDGTVTEKDVISAVAKWFEDGTLDVPPKLSEDEQPTTPNEIAVTLVAEVLDKLTMCAFL